MTGPRWQQAAALLLTFVFTALTCGPLRADTVRFDTGASPVFFVQLDEGSIFIRTWNQTAVQVDSGNGVRVRHVPSQAVGERLPVEMMLWSQRIQTPSGDMILPPEAFVFPNLNNAPHDAILVHGGGSVTITMPAGTALVVGNVRRGTVNIDGYKNGVFVAHVGAGAVSLQNVSGTGAVQVNNGPVIAANSDFSRLRVRTGRGNMRFQNCNATQIEATSLTGSIMYDDGTFAPGLARFESERGDVILGVTNGVQIGAHSSAGKIFSDSGTRAGATDQQVIFGHGGPVVTATSSTGSVIFYNGALRDHPDLQRRFAWRAPMPPGIRLPQPLERRRIR